MSLSSFFSSFVSVVHADAPEDKEVKEPQEEEAQEEPQEEEEEHSSDIEMVEPSQLKVV